MNAPPPKPRRRQASLRVLLALTAGLAALCLGPIRVQQRSRAIDALQVAGAELVFNDPRLLTGLKLAWPICWLAGNDRRELLSVVIDGQGIEQLRRIALFPEIELVVIVNGARDLDSDDAEVLGKLPNLQTLYIGQTGIGEGAVAGLSASQSLLRSNCKPSMSTTHWPSNWLGYAGSRNSS